jgi:hypothetical protein
MSDKDLSEIEAYINGDQSSAVVTEFTTGINDLNNAKISVYPNPANDMLFVEVSEEADIQMLDLNGKVIIMKARVNANETIEIDVESLASGVYFMRIYNDSFNSIRKVVIQK